MSRSSQINKAESNKLQQSQDTNEPADAAGLPSRGAGAIVSFDSGSYNPGPTIPPLVILTSAIGDALATNIVIGNGMWGPEGAILGAKINLSDLGFPPWAQIVGRDGVITEWAASLESVAAAEVDKIMALLDPSIELPTVNASLWHAAAPTHSPALIAELDWQLVSDVSIGQVPLVSTIQTFHGDTFVPDYPVKAGDFLIVRFYINTNLIVAGVAGFHAGATVNIV